MRGTLLQLGRGLMRMDALIAGIALVSMALIPMVEMVLRPLHGQGIENAPVLVQHLGLWVAMMGAVFAQRQGHLSSLSLPVHSQPLLKLVLRVFSQASGSVISGMLCLASWNLVATEIDATQTLAYGLPLWWVQFFCHWVLACCRFNWHGAVP